MSFSHVSTEKNAQYENCELSFIWDEMRTIAWETAFQVALKSCSEGQVRIIYDFREGGVHAIKHTFWEMLAASHEEHLSPLIILVLL